MSAETSSTEAPVPKAVIVWLALVLFLIFMMVIVGGATRLTGSGLSMVEWRPLMGALPPIGEAEWQAVFAKYQLSPQYQQVNRWMTLADFKQIFAWEYGHRLLGRLIGVVFFLPWLYFVVRRQLRGPWVGRTALAFVLGGLQGLLGWFMVKSGLVDVPAVSHFRLAAHLMLALLVGMWVLWLIAEITESERVEAPRWTARAAWGVVAGLVLQIVYGAFMAGKRAGSLYATFPDMNGSLWPPEASALEPYAKNLVDNPAFIHAFHRSFAWLVVLATIVFCAKTWSVVWARRQRTALAVLGAVVLVQLVVGALTVVLHVPIVIAVLHQGLGVLCLAQAVFVAHALRVPHEAARTAPIAELQPR